MFINESKKVIEMSAAEYKAAMTYGTEEFESLCRIRTLYPAFKPVEVKVKVKKAEHANLKKEEIEAFVREHGDDRQKREYLCLTNPYDDKGRYAGAASFFTVKEWFLAEFPNYKRTERSEEIRKINEAIAKKIAEKKEAEALERYNNYKDYATEFVA